MIQQTKFFENGVGNLVLVLVVGGWGLGVMLWAGSGFDG